MKLVISRGSELVGPSGYQTGPNRVIPAKPVVKELVLSQEDVDEIEARFEMLKPYLKPGAPSV